MRIDNRVHPIFRPFEKTDYALYKKVKELKQGNRLEKIAGNTLGNMAYAATGTVLSFPNGNAMPGRMQEQSLKRQGRHPMTYCIWGISANIAWQGVKMGVAYGAASTDTYAGYGAAAGLGAWTAFKFVEIPARIFVVSMLKRPLPYLHLEGVYRGYIEARKGIQKLNFPGRISDTIKVSKSLLKDRHGR